MIKKIKFSCPTIFPFFKLSDFIQEGEFCSLRFLYFLIAFEKLNKSFVIMERSFHNSAQSAKLSFCVAYKS